MVGDSILCSPIYNSVKWFRNVHTYKQTNTHKNQKCYRLVIRHLVQWGDLAKVGSKIIVRRYLTTDLMGSLSCILCLGFLHSRLAWLYTDSGCGVYFIPTASIPFICLFSSNAILTLPTVCGTRYHNTNRCFSSCFPIFFNRFSYSVYGLRYAISQHQPIFFFLFPLFLQSSFLFCLRPAVRDIAIPTDSLSLTFFSDVLFCVCSIVAKTRLLSSSFG